MIASQLCIGLFLQVAVVLFDSVIHLQLFAHLPLSDIYMPANVLQEFELIIKVVSFDYFPPFDYIEVGFTDTEAISPQFDWVGYGS